MQPVIIAHDAGNRFATQRMLAQLYMRQAILPFCTFLLPVRGMGLAPCLLMALDVPRPNAGNVKIFSSACAAGNQLTLPIRKCTLTAYLPHGLPFRAIP